MARIIISVTLVFIALTSYSQRKRSEPISVIILKPREVLYDSKYQKYIDKRSSEINYEINNPIISIQSTAGEEDKITRRSSIFKKNVDYFSFAAFASQDYLELVCMGLDKPCPVIVKEFKGDSKNLNLQQLAEKERKQYILDFSRIEILEKNEIFLVTISVRFYNNATKQFLIDSIFTGVEKEEINLNLEGLPLDCDSPMDCAYFNALSKIISKVICSLNCGWIAEEVTLEQKRKQILIDNYYNQKFDKNVLRTIFPANDTTFDINIAYQALFNNDSTKFIAFFLEQVTDTAVLKRMYLGDGDYKSNLVCHSYIRTGVKYKEKWYFDGLGYGNGTSFLDSTIELRKKDLFDQLQTYHYGFFKEGTAEPDPLFWCSRLFAVAGDTINRRKYDYNKADELNYQPYKGLYLVVAKEFRKIKKAEEDIIEKQLIEKYIAPLIEKLKLTPQYEGRPLIYPDGMKMILVPIVETRPNNKVGTRYFVLLVDERGNYNVYEWTYYNPERVRNYSWGGYYDEDLKKLTNWEHGFDYLNDQGFWTKYILAKENGEFKYLRKIN